MLTAKESEKKMALEIKVYKSQSATDAWITMSHEAVTYATAEAQIAEWKVIMEDFVAHQGLPTTAYATFSWTSGNDFIRDYWCREESAIMAEKEDNARILAELYG